MKRIIVGILVTGMIMASLTGCGTEAKATEQKEAEKNTAVVAVESSSEDENAEAEVEEDNEEEGSTGWENDDIVLYAEIPARGDYGSMQEQPFEAENNTFIAYEDIPLYNVDGIEVGYAKTGSTVNLTESAANINWARFKNPIDGTDYDYLYVLKKYMEESQKIETMLSAEEMKQLIIDEINNRNFELATILDAPTSDMEVYECRISRENDSMMLNYWLMDAFHNADKFQVGNYMTYYLECEEDEDYIICRLYYKDLYNGVGGNN